MNSPVPDQSVKPPNRLYGVGGWLIVLCLSLTIIAPIFQLKVAATALQNLLSPKHLSQSTLLRLDAVVVIYAGMAVFSCICGYRLWTEDPGAPALTKAYLVIATVVVISLDSVLTLAGMRMDLF